MKPLHAQSNGRPPAPAGQERGRRAAGRLLAVLGLALAVGCSPLRLLGPRQRLLSKVTVESDGLSPAQQERMLTLVQQKPNRNIPVPRLAIYQLGHSVYDSARIERHIQEITDDYAAKLKAAGTDSVKLGRLVARRDRRLARKRLALEKGNAVMRLGEPPVVYDPGLSARTVEQLRIYLHSQGFFRAQVSYSDTARARRSPGGFVRNLLGRKPTHSAPLRDSLSGQRLHRRVAVTYTVTEGPGFTYSRLSRIVPDSGVARLFRQGQAQTLLHPGDAYNEDVIGQERLRLETLLKNHGYYDFRAQLISFEADTSFEKQQVRLRLLVARPPGGLRPYRLQQVTLLTDVGRARALRSLAGDTTQLNNRERRRAMRAVAADTAGARAATGTPGGGAGTGRISTASLPAGVTPAAVSDTLTARRLRRQGLRAAPRDTTVRDSVLILSRGPLRLSPRVLVRQVALRPGQLYSLDRTQRTQRLLSGLDMFRFNTVSYRKAELPGRTARLDTADVDVSARPTEGDSVRLVPGGPARRPPTAPTEDVGYLTATITTSPNPRFSYTSEFGGTYVATKPGPFGNLRLKWRNPFGGAEVLELSARLGFEGQYARLDPSSSTEPAAYTTLQYGGSLALLVPQVLAPFGLGRYVRNYQPHTRVSVSNIYTRTPYYRRSLTEATFDYIWQPSLYQQFVFTPVDIGITSTPFLSDAYQNTLNQLQALGSPLYQSFRSVYEPSFSFTSLYNSNDINQTRSGQYLRVFVELGGLTRDLYRNSGWFQKTDLAVYNFAKLAVDYRRYHRLSSDTYLAWRLNGGVVRALTPTEPPVPTESRYQLPYDKYFFAGGSNSVRAWTPRRLGTGSYATYTSSNERDYVTEQPGNVLLEGALEYRFPLYSFFKGAVFTDFGNVWSLQPDDTRHDPPPAGKPANGDARFHLDSFYRQFAVGSGLGVRMDFTFIILRFDVATKVYDPTDPEPWRIRQALRQYNNQTVVNVGIGYPF